jgi:hypothetical protein
MKFILHRIGKEVWQTATYQTVKDYIIQLVQKSFRNGKDVADSIRKMDRLDMTSKIPVQKLSRATDADDRATQQEGYDILYKAELDMFTKRKHKLEDNMNKTYSLIYLQHCNKTIQDRVHAHPDFETKIKNDSIELLKAIEILINDPVRARYPYASVTEAMTRFMTCRQLQNEPLANYVKRFKSCQDSMAQNMGKDFQKDFVKNMKQYADETNTDKQDEMLKGSYAQWKAYMLMKHSNQGKYGLRMTSLTTQVSMGTNQYPKDVMAAVDILTNHRFNKKEPKNNNQRNRNQNNDDTALTITTQSSFNQEALKKATCYCCSKKGHYLNKCPEKDKRSKDEWVVKKTMMHAQAKLEKETKEKDDNDNASHALRRSNKSNTQSEWNNLIIKKESLHNNSKQWASSTKENSILMDNGSTLSLFGNPKMVTNIRESKTALELATNAGTRTTKKIADVPGYGTVWYDKTAIANIFGLSELKKKHRVTYDSEKEDAFIVHMNDDTLKFECNPEGLYTYKVTDEYLKKQSHLINRVKENRVGYTQRQFEQAKRAQEPHHIVGTPTIESFKALITMNAIKNFPVTTEDVNNAKKNFGANMSSLRGKSTRCKSTPVREDAIKIPEELIS